MKKTEPSLRNNSVSQIPGVSSDAVAGTADSVNRHGVTYDITHAAIDAVSQNRKTGVWHFLETALRPATPKTIVFRRATGRKIRWL